MATRDRSRTFLVGAAVAALLAPLAIVAAMASPASAAQMKQHEVYMYKVEKHVDLVGEYPEGNLHEHVYCNPGDIALDGMWRIDNVEQANPPETNGDERDVYFTASYGDDVDRTEWHFRARNYADGIAQIKLFVTCIRGNVEQAFLHSHQVRISDRFEFNQNGLTPGDHLWNYGDICGPDAYAVAPGWNITSHDYDHKARIYKSWPTSNYRGWEWAFRVEHSANINIRVYLRCLRTTVTANGPGPNPHSHEIPMEYRPDFDGKQELLNVLRTQERRLNCDDGAFGQNYQNYKGMVAGFWITDPTHVWFLGMDPRPKQRAFKYWWDGAGFNDVYHTLLCVRARTMKQIAPVV